MPPLTVCNLGRLSEGFRKGFSGEKSLDVKHLGTIGALTGNVQEAFQGNYNP
jgi:hypothetical protein